MKHLRTLPLPHKNLRIGLFGGSFNPAHSGHFHVAEQALKTLNLDAVWWLVARGNPLKLEHGDFETRYKSAQQYAKHKRMIVSDLEQSASLTYSIDTVKFLRRRCPTSRFVWVMGSDNLENFHYWRNWEEFANLVPLCLINRPTSLYATLNSRFARRFEKKRVRENEVACLLNNQPPAWGLMTAPYNYESSTDLREQRRVL